jgi:hypothetical protein
MANVTTKKDEKKLLKYKKQVERFQEFFRSNYIRWHKMKIFILESALTNEDREVLRDRQMPELEFNNVEPYFSRLVGEWYNQDPGIVASSRNGEMVDPNLLKFIEGYFRHILDKAKDKSTFIESIKDTMIGGFTTLELHIEYEGKSFTKCPVIKKNQLPTLVYYDPMALDVDKSDGEYCGKIYPKTKQEFEEEFKEKVPDDMKFFGEMDGFSWSYNSQKDEDILLVAEHYTKKKINKTLVEIRIPGSNEPKAMFMDEYEEFLEKIKQTGALVAPPQIARSRSFEQVQIWRTFFIDGKILKEERTDFDRFPLVFVDGNSSMMQHEVDMPMFQYCRGYFHNVVGALKLRNMTGQSLANEIENISQAKMKIAKESIPTEREYQNSYRNPQKANMYVYNAYMDNSPETPVPAPQEIMRQPIPPEITQTFMITDQLTQLGLGAYDSTQGIMNNDVSGQAITKGSMQSNAAAKPYLINMFAGINSIARAILYLIPRLHKTPATLPIIHADGTRDFIKVNQPDGSGISLDYDPESLNITVEAGASFKVQKDEALRQITAMMSAYPGFAEFITTSCLEEVIDNMEFRGSDSLKVKAKQFMEMKQQQQQMAMQQQQQMMQEAQKNNPVMIKAQMDMKKLELEAQKQQDDKVIEAAKVGIQQMQADTDRIEVMLKAGDSHANRIITKEKHDTENYHSATELAIKAASSDREHAKGLIELEHKILQANKEHRID